MKLRNCKTGEIRPAEAREDGIYLYDETTDRWYKYELSLLAQYWEYYKEPKEYWYIDYDGKIKCFKYLDFDWQKEMQAIGNHFEIREEAEKVREKLKAITRLSKCGFKFEGYADKDRANGGDIVIYAHVDIPHNNLLEEAQPAMLHDLDLLFGGGE